MLIILFTFFFSGTFSLKPLGRSYEISDTINPGFGVEYCVIPKTGSTVTKEILCEILRAYKGKPQRDPKRGHSINLTSECEKRGNYLFDLTTKWQRPLLETIKFTTVRDPVERFVSIYGYICPGYWCPPSIRNIHQFARWLYNAKRNENGMMARVQTKKTDYVLWHSAPQTSFCGIGSETVHIVHHSRDRGKMRGEMLRVLRKAHVPNNVANKALRHLFSSTTVHASRSNAERKKLLKAARNPQTMVYIKAIYHRDFRFLKEHKLQD
ncbi:unnamed protein product, partial [Mesorhabditis belari]|uniref:Sulfotransferase family protein n=1 Tax=Mesorhabditis belari TaxID=2138241 RepID=A0AAF3J681_9BILA